MTREQAIDEAVRRVNNSLRAYSWGQVDILSCFIESRASVINLVRGDFRRVMTGAE